MKEKDFKKIHELTESFINEVEKNNLHEGFSDIAKAKWAGFKGGIKGFGKQIQGNINKTTGNLINKGIDYVAKGVGADPTKSTWAKSAQSMASKGQSQIDTGKNLAYNEKYNTYIKSIVDSIVNDLKDLNININNKGKLVTDIKNSITLNTKQPPGGKQQPTPQAPSTGAQQTTQTPVTGKQQTPQAPATGKKQTVQTPIAGKQQTPQAPATGKQQTPAQGKTPSKEKQYAGQWLSPTQRVSLSGPQQGVMTISPDDPSQVENPYSPSYNKDVAEKRVSNAQKGYKNPENAPSTTTDQPEPKQEKQPNSNVDAKKKQAREKVMSKMK